MRPCWRGVQHCEYAEGGVGKSLHNAIGRCPIEPAGLWLEVRPGEGLPHPGQAGSLDARQVVAQSIIIVLFERDVDADGRPVGQVGFDRVREAKDDAARALRVIQ